MKTATISTGGAEYNKSEAAVDIEGLIAELEQARDSGATHIVLLSGNYRGAKYMRMGTVHFQE
jgi:hypothetical protein